MKLMILFIVSIFTFGAFAQVDVEQAAALLKPVLELAVAYLPENLHAILTLIGGFRLVFKPLMVLFKAIADASGDEKIKGHYEKTASGNTYKTIQFIFDYIASIKLPEKK